MGIEVKTVRVNGFSMDYFSFGRGERTLVILPGLSAQSVMGAAEAVAAAYAPLAEDFTVWLFDRRREIPPDYSLRAMAEDTAAAFRALRLEQVCLFGASQGGMIALMIAIEHPELVDKLALGSSSARVTDAQFETLAHWEALARARDRAGLYLDFGGKLYPPAIFAQCREGLIAASQSVTDAELDRFVILTESMRDFDVTDRLSEIRCPVLALGDFDDNVLDADATMEIAENLDHRPDFRLYLYAGCGHAAFDTAPDYKQRLLDFFL